MMLRNALLGASLLALPVAASAQPISGLYVGAGAGFNWSQNIDVKSASVAGVSTRFNNAHLNSAGGFVGLGSIGWGLGNGLRLELEGNYRANHTNLKAAGANGGGDLETFGVMVNALYDFAIGVPYVQPYVGAGVGYAWTFTNNGVGYTTAGAPAGRFALNNESQGSIAAQAILGAAIPTGIPGLSVTAEYRFFAAFEDTKYKATFTSGAASAPGTVTLGPQYNHAGMVGLRYAFNAAPPPPPPAPAPVAAPAPAPARTYLVFFDWDKADLTARARQIIAEAAQNSTRVQLTQIEVAGHADRTGTAQYNMALSRKRAENVAAELVRLGVPRNAISIQAFGDSKPLVPTAPGVREPQNRRVEIVLK